MIDRAIEQAIADGVFPGASLLVAQRDKIIFSKVYGYAQKVPVERKMQPGTLFDMASLTKPICTATLYMLAIQEKTCALTDALSRFYPDTKSSITLHHLLNHTSGLPSWKPYYQELLKEAPGWIADPKGKEWLVSKILKEKNPSPPAKMFYSDLGYILLGDILEKIYSKPLAQLFNEKVSIPFGLLKTFFNPISREEKTVDDDTNHYAATEQCPWREKVLCGEVMDDHAYLMGGVAGHAGLFSDAHDCFEWLLELQKAKKGTSDLITKKTFNLFCGLPKNRDRKIPFFTLGFDTPILFSSSGKYFSSNTLGHLGYSGTSFWWDLEKEVIIIFLTNRVHPSRENEKIKKFRPLLHDCVWESLLSQLVAT